jgi:ribosomal protein L13E
MSQVQVQGGNGKIRGGRGFSKKELEAAGVSLKQLKAEGLGYDSRRRTCRDVNVAALKEAFSAE